MSAHDQGLFRCLGQEGLSEEVTCRVVDVKSGGECSSRVNRQGQGPEGGRGTRRRPAWPVTE